MRQFLLIIALTCGLTTTASTADAQVSWGEELRFVTHTDVPDGRGKSLCHLVSYAEFFFIPVYSTMQGYAFSANDCEGSTYFTITAEQFANLQAAEHIPADLPTTPTADLRSLLWGHAWLILGGVAILFRLLGAPGNRRRGPRKAKAPDALAIHSLVAMSQVAIADGRIDDAEVQQISSILTRLTGNAYAPPQVMDLLSRLNPSPSDIDQIGEGLSNKDRQIVLEAALNIAVADGEIHPNEYAVVSDLAQRMRIGADQFRSAMARISAHLKTVQPV